MVHCTPNPYAAQIGGSTHNHLVVGTDGLNVRDFKQHTLTMVTNNKNDAKVKDEQPKDHDGEVVLDDSENKNSNKLSTFRPISELEALERTLVWSNICPTAPASVGSIPTSDFVLEETPKLYFCGNCEEGFATKLSSSSSSASSMGPNTNNKTRLICVPKFHETGEAVLVNLRTLEVELLRFQDEVPSPE
jgi:DNA polymerase delta subunit 2